MLKHVVLLKLQPDSEGEDCPFLTEELRHLKQVIPGILSLSCGKNRKFNKDKSENSQYSHLYTMSFIDEDYYQLYQQHPDTIDFLSRLKEKCLPGDSMMILEYPLEFILSP